MADLVIGNTAGFGGATRNDGASAIATVLGSNYATASGGALTLKNGTKFRNNTNNTAVVSRRGSTDVTIAEDITISTNTQEVDLSDRVLGGTVTVNLGIYIWSDNTGTPALNLGGPYTVNNSGYIIGKGGAGATGGNGASGGPAVAIASGTTGVTITNNSSAYIAGGGGGGGSHIHNENGGGGGAGGGAGGNSNTRHDTMQGGAGGAVGQSGSDGESWGAPYTDDNYGGSDGGKGDPIGFGGGAGGGGGSCIDTGSSNGRYGGAGGGGGRILPGTGGGGGVRYGNFRPSSDGSIAVGGDGGSASSVGDQGLSTYGREDGAGGGGGWGATGGAGNATNTGGAGGAAINDNGNTYTLTNNGTIYGTT